METHHVGAQKLTLRFDYQEYLQMNNRARQRESEILAKAKDNFEQRTVGVQKALSNLRNHNAGSSEEARDLHLRLQRRTLNRKRVEKFLMNDDADGRLLERIEHRL